MDEIARYDERIAETMELIVALKVAGIILDSQLAAHMKQFPLLNRRLTDLEQEIETKKDAIQLCARHGDNHETRCQIAHCRELLAHLEHQKSVVMMTLSSTDWDIPFFLNRCIDNKIQLGVAKMDLKSLQNELAGIQAERDRPSRLMNNPVESVEGEQARGKKTTLIGLGVAIACVTGIVLMARK